MQVFKQSSSDKRISLPFPTKNRREDLYNYLVQVYGEGYLDDDVSNASYKIQYGKVEIRNTEDTKVLQRYNCAFELIAIPLNKDTIRADPSNLSSEFVGAVNCSYSALGTKFKGDYRWTRKDGSRAWAYDIMGCLREYKFVFGQDYRTKKDKVPCLIYGNLISDRIDYSSKSKAEFDTSPFTDTIRQAVASVSRKIKTFKDYGIEFASDKRRSYRDETWKEPKIKRTSIKKVVEMMLLPRIEKVKAGEKITTKQTQDSLWYNALPLFEKYNVRYSNGSRPGFKNCIRELCKEHDVDREEIGIIAAPWGGMFFDGEWYDISYERLEELADKGTDIIFIEKRDIVIALSEYARKKGIALVNTHGHFTEYVKDLAEFAETSGANLGIVTDCDEPGVLIASKLVGVVWLGVDERMLEYFGLSHEDKMLVVGYHPDRRMKDETVDELFEDERFSHVDTEFIKHKKIEIDAILAKVGSENLWNYLMELLDKEHPKRNYTRVIDSSYYSQEAVSMVGEFDYAPPSIVSDLKRYIRTRAEDITKERRDEIEKELEDYDGFVDSIDEEEEEIMKEINEIVDEDKQIEDVSKMLTSITKTTESTVRKAVVAGIKKLDQEKGYDIMKKLGLKEEEEEQDRGGEGS
jgi:hypothetical protein